MIRTMSAAGLALAILVTVAAAAEPPAVVELPADAALVPEAPPQVPVFSWTGGYVGVHVGYGLGRDSVTSRTRFGDATSGGNTSGVLGGLHVGYNRALGGVLDHPIVAGVEGDVDGADDQRTGALARGLGTAAVRSDIKGSIRARLGLAASRVLYYATGGAAFANFDTRFNGTARFGPGAFEAYQRTQAGYTLGGGVEYAFLNYVSVRAEYRHTDYGSFTDPLGGAAPGYNASVTHRDSDNRLQAGVSYRFD